MQMQLSVSVRGRGKCEEPNHIANNTQSY
jgi:hypothetical protein